jgi:hypothetical protein
MRSYKSKRTATGGMTVLEVLIAVFVLLIGITGIVSLFPVGVRLSQMGTDDVISSMTARNALAAVRMQEGLKAKLESNVLGFDANLDPTTGVYSVLGIEGTVAVVQSSSHLQPTIVAPTRALKIDDGSPGGTDEDDCALLLMTSGQGLGKLYRLGEDTTGTESSFSDLYCSSTLTSLTDFEADGVEENDRFRLIGSRDDSGVWATVPDDFFNPSGGYVLGPGAVTGYGYLAIITPVYDVPNSYQVDILVYKTYDTFLPPEGNQRAVACFSTVLSGDMLR